MKRRHFIAAMATLPVLGAVQTWFNEGDENTTPVWLRGPEHPEGKAYWERAMAGNAEAQFDLAIAYEIGEGAPVDLRCATYWLHRAAINGFPEAQAYLGHKYRKGQHFPANSNQASYWLYQAASQGDPIAQWEAGKPI